MREINRINPLGGAAAYKTYQIVAPRATHWRSATCAEIGCRAHERGWKTLADLATVQGQRMTAYIRSMSGRAFTEERTSPTTITFTFSPGQQCFGSDKHQVPLEKDPIYVVRGGDWRGNPRGDRRIHTRPADWVDDFATHQGRLADTIERG
jgi:hypothetical protein